MKLHHLGFSLVVGALGGVGIANAGPNLLTNGSFEAGLTGWTHGGTAPSFPVVAITYGAPAPYPTGAFGEAVPAPNDVSASPDAPGTRGAYFVDDHSVNESLSEMVFLTAGNYAIGFDAYAPNNGYANPVDATLTAQIAGVTLASYAVSTRPSATWLNFSGLLTILNSGFYSASFVFNTPGTGAAKDIVIDRAFIVASTIGGTAIPEPETVALFGIAAAALALTRVRRKA